MSAKGRPHLRRGVGIPSKIVFRVDAASGVAGTSAKATAVHRMVALTPLASIINK